jgi:hypothetical protein
MGRLGVHALIEEGGQDGAKEGLLAKLKRGLGKVVDCFAFGAVMDEAKFWEVVEAVLRGEDVPGAA